MIYGTPGETLTDVEITDAATTEMQPDHVSAYSLIVEGNTKMARQLRGGELSEPDPDFMADAYELIADRTRAAGFEWYEVSNFARGEEFQCRHNLTYWRGRDWWGIGPGAHRHRDGYRSWNLKHPSRYAAALAQNRLPVDGSEQVSDEDRALERLMLEMRLRKGFFAASNPLTSSDEARVVLEAHVAAGRLDAKAWENGIVRLSDAGRLIADAITREVAAL